MNTEYKPRFSFEISEEQRIRSNKSLEAYGIRKAIFSNILDDVLDIIDQHGNLAIGLMVSHKVKPREIIPTIKQVDEVGGAKGE
jgi:hypothetical protein